MALIQCPECQNTISDKAVKCPHCGYPLETLPTQPLPNLAPSQKGEVSEPSVVENLSTPATTAPIASAPVATAAPPSSSAAASSSQMFPQNFVSYQPVAVAPLYQKRPVKKKTVILTVSACVLGFIALLFIAFFAFRFFFNFISVDDMQIINWNVTESYTSFNEYESTVICKEKSPLLL